MKAFEMTFEQLCQLLSYTPKNRRLTTAEAAEVLGIKASTLMVKRSTGGGPKYIKPPGTKYVSYSELDLLQYMAAGRYTSSSQRATA